jgi:mRNA-degrading endonuclease RelE of RelBE toxin-antitoxin system
VTSHTTERFRKAFQKLPPHVQRKAREAYRLWQQDHWHMSLQFKQVHNTKPIYSVRIGIGWRALGVKTDDTIVWFWIGSHADYDNLLAQM